MQFSNIVGKFLNSYIFGSSAKAIGAEIHIEWQV
jgi:hypothetical protein